MAPIMLSANIDVINSIELSKIIATFFLLIIPDFKKQKIIEIFHHRFVYSLNFFYYPL